MSTDIWALRPLEPNRARAVHVGHGAHPVLVVDDVFQNPWSTRDASLKLCYDVAHDRYPGHSAHTGLSADALVAWLNPMLETALVPRSVSPVYASIFEPELPENIAALRRPHADVNCDLAIVIYLNAPEQCRGGTSFYRLLGTSLERYPVVAEPIDVLGALIATGDTTFAALENRVATAGGDGDGIILDGDRGWERTALVDMRFNRLVAYDAHLFHSLYVRPEWFRGSAPEDRRLTLNFALKGQVAWRLQPRSRDLMSGAL